MYDRESYDPPTLPLDSPAFIEDMAKFLVGRHIGSGIHRDVYEYALDHTKVIKIERKHFYNIYEYEFWCQISENKEIRKWFAPIHWISNFGTILIQSKTTPLHFDQVSKLKVPDFLTDVKMDNFGWFEGRLVCHDYAFMSRVFYRGLRTKKMRPLCPTEKEQRERLTTGYTPKETQKVAKEAPKGQAKPRPHKRRVHKSVPWRLP